MSEERLFRGALAASVLLHGAVFLAGSVPLGDSLRSSTVEFDITRPVCLAPGGGNPGPARPRAAETHPEAKPAPLPAAKAEEWTLPAKDQAVPPPPTASAEASASAQDGLVPGPGLAGAGGEEYDLGDGSAGTGATLSRFPQLVNFEQLRWNLSFYYPPAERRARREGTVGMVLHIDQKGRVTSVEVSSSGGPAFDAAARRVAAALRFTPAQVQGIPVAVKLRQAIRFRLDEK